MTSKNGVLTQKDLDHPESIDYQALIAKLKPTIQGTYDSWLLYGYDEDQHPHGDRLIKIAIIRNILEDLGYCGLWSEFSK